MIYSDLFDGMPTAIRERLYRRLYDILSGKDTSEKYGPFSEADRKAVLEIVLDTKTNLPAYWRDTALRSPEIAVRSNASHVRDDPPSPIEGRWQVPPISPDGQPVVSQQVDHPLRKKSAAPRDREHNAEVAGNWMPSMNALDRVMTRSVLAPTGDADET